MISGLVYGFGALGIFGAGWLGDRAFRRSVSGRLHVAWVAIALAIPCLLGALQVPEGQAWICAAYLLPGHLLLYFYYGTVYASIQDIVPPRLRGMAMALYFCGMYILGALWGPAGTGWISDTLALRAADEAGAVTFVTTLEKPTVDRGFSALGRPGAWSVIPGTHAAEGLHQALYVVPLLCTLLVLVLMAAARTLERDARRLKTN